MRHLIFEKLDGCRGNYHLAVTRIEPGRTTDVHDHDYYEWFLVTSGSGWHVLPATGKSKSTKAAVRERRSPLREGVLVWIRPEDTHGYATSEDRMEFINLAFSARWWETFCELYSPRLEIPAHVDQNLPACHAQLPELDKSRLVECFHRKLAARTQERSDLLEMCLLLVETWLGLLRTNDAPLWLLQLRAEMLQPKNLPLGIRDWQRRSGYSAAHLSREIRRCFGCTPTDLLQRARIDYFCFLVRARHEKILTAAQEAGFQQLANFYKTFHRVHGCSPRIWLARQEKIATVPG